MRRFLGNKGRINRGIEKTLRETPELFGLYNNGITIVVTDFQPHGNGTVQLIDPYVVNGCQTTRTTSSADTDSSHRCATWSLP